MLGTWIPAQLRREPPEEVVAVPEPCTRTQARAEWRNANFAGKELGGVAAKAQASRKYQAPKPPEQPKPACRTALLEHKAQTPSTGCPWESSGSGLVGEEVLLALAVEVAAVHDAP